MKKISCSIIFVFISIVCSQSDLAQTPSSNNAGKSLEVVLGKSRYVLLEPITARFRYETSSSDMFPPEFEDSAIRVTVGGKTREFSGLKSGLLQGRPLPLPQHDKTPRPVVYEKEIMIDRTADFFPSPGSYKVEFAFAGVKSNEIHIQINEPVSIDREAFNFLQQFDHPLTYQWVFDQKDGIELLKTFVDQYSDSVYGDTAIYQLGLIFFNKGEFEKAKTLFERLAKSKYPTIAADAKQQLNDIASNIKAKEATNSDKHQPEPAPPTRP
jgi:hypothetical protein